MHTLKQLQLLLLFFWSAQHRYFSEMKIYATKENLHSTCIYCIYLLPTILSIGKSQNRFIQTTTATTIDQSFFFSSSPTLVFAYIFCDLRFDLRIGDNIFRVFATALWHPHQKETTHIYSII